MKILFLSQRVPYPPNKGDKLRSFNEIKYLSRSHQISLVCLSDNEADILHAQELLAYCSSVDIVPLSPLRSRINAMLALFSVVPLTCAYFYSPALQELVTRKLRDENFDLIMVYCSSMAQYVDKVYHISKVIDLVDVDSEKWQKYAHYAPFPKNLIYQMESRRLRNYEASLARTYQHCFLVSEKECEDFRNLVAAVETLTPILNGVDLEMFQPGAEPYNPHVLVFTGAMDYFANVEAVLYFTREILPYIQSIVPEVVLHVVGSNPGDELRTLAKSNPSIVVTGFVDHVQPYMAQAAVFVAPMRIARGVQNKILESMAMGVPVVTSSLGFEGISARPGVDIFVEDEPEAFARQVIRLMTEADLRDSLSRSARAMVERKYDWASNLLQLDVVLSGVVAKWRITSDTSKEKK